MRSDKILERVMDNPTIRNLGLKEEAVLSIINAYSDMAITALLENGNIELDNGMNIEVVQLIDRVHVLRGITYQSNRRYKLKLTMEDVLYERIDSYYENLKKEIQ